MIREDVREEGGDAREADVHRRVAEPRDRSGGVTNDSMREGSRDSGASMEAGPAPFHSETCVREHHRRCGSTDDRVVCDMLSRARTHGGRTHARSTQEIIHGHVRVRLRANGELSAERTGNELTVQ